MGMTLSILTATWSAVWLILAIFLAAFGVEFLFPIVELSLASLAAASLALVVAATKEKYRG